MLLHILSSEMHREALKVPFELPESFVRTHQVVAVLTGGTESKFLQLVDEGLIDLSRPVYLMVSGHSNSLAAALEILSYIRQHNGTGKVMMNADDTELEGTGDRLPITGVPSEPVLRNEKKLRLGVVGKPSDWLISSGVDYAEVLKKMNCELVEIPIDEVSSLGELESGMKGAEAIYKRLKELVNRYDLQGITLRCFDLLTTVKNTGCIALSKLNDEGIPAACEGDIPTLLMTEKHEYTTHFESGIGVAIHGDLPAGDYTLVKLSGDMQRILAEDVTLERCQYEPNLCRTQVWIKATPAVSRYFLTSPIANHHVLIKGHYAKLFKQ